MASSSSTAASRSPATDRGGVPIRVRVNDELTLDAGLVGERVDGDDRVRIVAPPSTTMFEQLLAYLEAKPAPSGRLSGTTVGREGVAAAALCLRWGSFFAVLADGDKPVWEEAASRERREATSRISDGEMARINIEASAAMAAWVDIFRAHRGMGDYLRLVEKAVAYLPMPQRSVTTAKLPEFRALARPGLREMLLGKLTPESRADAVRAVEEHPTRVFTNALVNHGWRNGPVEDVHAGEWRGYPLDRRRVTAAEERSLVKHAAASFATGMNVCLGFVSEPRGGRWSEQVVPYAHAHMLLITPGSWTLTERSREVRYYIESPNP